MRAALSSCSIRSARILLQPRLPRYGVNRGWPRYAASSVPPTPKTYFQDQDLLPASRIQEPPRTGSRLIWRFVRGSIVAFIAFAVGLQTHVEMHRFEDQDEGEEQAIEARPGAFSGPSQAVKLSDAASYARFMLSIPESDNLLQVMMPLAAHAALDTITHHSVVAANARCEDHSSSADLADQYVYWGIFDGHAGDHCSRPVSDAAALTIASELVRSGIIDANGLADLQLPTHKQDYRSRMKDSLSNAFLKIDQIIMKDAKDALETTDNDALMDLADAVYLSSAGSCGLVAFYDSISSQLWVANAGDSRAVLGRWDASQQRYTAIPLSEDHTGFNEKEVQRLQAEHPGEKVVDPATGRVFGLAVTRAFGDARWKWPDELNQLAHERFGAHPPRPGQVIKTPPYITAEPEVQCIDIQTQPDRPDFLIMASDGLWDKMSSEEAVQCVDLWLSKSAPDDALRSSAPESPLDQDSFWPHPKIVPQQQTDDPKQAAPTSASDHWVIETTNCAAHLIQNALGGDRRSNVVHCMTLGTPFSRNVFDDITVNVIFFKQDTAALPASPTEDLTG